MYYYIASILVTRRGRQSTFLRHCVSVCLFVCLFLAQQPPVGQGLLSIEVSRPHTTTHHSR